MDYKKEAEEFFKDDKFATKQAGIIIDEVCDDISRCSMIITPDHLNAVGSVMGGAIFTLADFTFGVAANMGRATTVTLSSNINFVAAAKTDKLYACAKPVKNGKSTCVYEINVYDNSDKLIANMTATGFRFNK